MELGSTLAARLAARQRAHLYRTRLCVDGPQGVLLNVDGQPLRNFAGNDYLGLANHPRVTAAMRGAIARYGVGAGASHLISGHTRAHTQLEEALAAFTKRPRALLFSTGYMANLGTVTALVGRGDVVFEDRRNHASLLDGGLLANSDFQRYGHCEATDLARRLAGSTAAVKLVVTDGVFSMAGDIAPLSELARVAAAHDAWLMVDDAHGLGVLGEQGGGTVEQFRLDVTQVPILMGTLGKALGVFGAFVAGCEALIEYLIQYARSYIYTTALPPALAAAALAALDVSLAEPWRRQWLQQLIQRFQFGANQLQLPTTSSTTPIQPLYVKDSAQTVRFAKLLRDRGYLVGAIRTPTVPVGSEQLRITLSANHAAEDVDNLLEALSGLPWRA